MKVQIYTAQTPEEARALVALGVDRVGITPANLGLPGEVDVETARAIVEAISGATSVALSVSAYHLAWRRIPQRSAASDGICRGG